jgi:hypothetical protein
VVSASLSYFLLEGGGGVGNRNKEEEILLLRDENVLKDFSTTKQTK